MAKVQYFGTGRRKTSVARVRLLPGDGQFPIASLSGFALSSNTSA